MALAASYAALKMAQYIKDATLLAARYEMLGVTMRVAGNTAGYTGAQMEKAAQGMQKMGISLIASRENAMKMVVAQLDLAKAADLARVAQDVARVANINSSEAFTRMIQGIRSGEVEIFKTMGLMINMDKAYRDFEKTNNLVKGSIDAGQRAQAVMNAVLIEGEKYAGLYAATMDTAAGQTLSMQRHVENLKVAFGLAFTPALAETIEQITGAVKDLNGELSGNSKDKITEWGTKFRIAIISVEAEIRRLAMLLDKLGGTMTSAQMLLYGPGRAMGVKSSTKRFEAAADANMEYEARYKANEAALEALAKKQIALEQSLTAEGKAAAKAAADAAESKVLAARKATTATEKAVIADEKAIAAAQKLREEWEKLKAELDFEKATAGMDDLDKALAEIERDMEKMRSNPNADLKLIDEIELQRQTTAIKAWYDEYLQEQIKANKKQYDADGQLLRDKLELYKDLTGFEDEYRQTQLEWIERIKNEEIKATKDVEAAEKKAADARARIEYDLFKTKTDYIADGFGRLQSTFSSLASIYEDGSDAARQWEEAARAMEIAQKAVAVVQAVAAIATQGLGDPYTAFARIAAMAATMGALLATIGEGIGGGGGSSSAASLPASTVLGAEAGTGSESISKTWELLEDTYDMEYRELSGIYDEMKSLNDNIMGLVTSYIRTGGVDNGNFNIQTGFEKGKIAGLISDVMNSKLLSGVLGYTLDNLFGGIMDSIFGGGTEISITGSGIATSSANVGSLTSGGGVGSRQYADVYTHTDGGWFHSDSNTYTTIYDDLDPQVALLLDKVFQGISSTLINLTTALGTDMQATLDYVFEGGKLNLRGMDADEINT
ncbi:MAG: hypothetical protein PHY29_11765, partial [Syntrophales bacterium]|nr:hypothetical protein [Syntrophales bacterium]